MKCQRDLVVIKHRRKFRGLFLTGVLIFCVALVKAQVAETKEKPNILFIYVDDWGWKDLGLNGSKFYETPEIDQLASEGLWFSQAYSVGPNCAPSRASLMTGLYTPRHGIYTVGTAERGNEADRKLIPVKNKTILDPGFTTIAEELKQGGYVTSLIGKWQLGNKDQEADASSQGFQHVISGAPGTSSYFFPYYSEKKAGSNSHVALEKGNEGEYLTDRLTDEAIRFIGSNQKKQPFFLYLSYFAVHTPMQGKEALVGKYRKKESDENHNNPDYAAMIESVDQGVGRLVRTLDSLKLSENTVVIFYSDNGGMGAVTNQLPLRGSKGMLYEGGIRVPLIVRWSKKVKPGVRDSPITGVDFYPTLLELTKTQPLENKVLDGRSFVPLLSEEQAGERDLFWHFPAYLEAYRGDKRNIAPFRTTPVSVIRSGDYKLLEFYEDGRKELYNLRNDIGETKNLTSQQPEKVKELSDRLATWRKRVNAFESFGKNPEYKPNPVR